MKWLSINSSSRQETYELINTNEKLLTLTYHPASGTIRISANDEKRVLLIGREGFLRRHTVLRNEYGVRMGQINHDSDDNQGNIDVYGEQFNYVLQNNLPTKAAVYRNTEMLVVCELPAVSKNNTGNGNYDLLILTLCWYMSTAVKKHEEEYA